MNGDAFSRWITDTFGPLLKPVFHPIDAALANVYMPWAKISALSLFIGAMIWVYTLRKEYVNLDVPGKEWWRDLRIWTIVSMLPHVVVYLYF